MPFMDLKSSPLARWYTAGRATTAQRSRSTLDAGLGAGLPAPQISSPWMTQPSSLSTIVWAEFFDEGCFPATRAQAMGVPAMAKARHVVAPKVAGYPLRQFRVDATTGEDTQVEDPIWATRTDGPLSPWHRMLWTVDDLIFNPYSLWKVRRGAVSDGLPILAADRVNIDEWCLNADNRIEVQGTVVRQVDYLLIPGPHEGVLQMGRTAIITARQLARNALIASQTPNAQTELHQTVDVDMEQEDIDTLLDGWAEARTGKRGGVAWTSYGVEARDHGAIDGALLIDGRNASAVDMARLVGVAAGMVDATAPKASLNYETQQGRGLEHTEYGVEPYMEAIAARLSMDDVCPRGNRIRFDISADLDEVEPTGPTVGD